MSTWEVSVKGVLRREGRVLLALNDRDEWELPGGRLEADENPHQALVREFEEESGLAVEPGALLLVEPLEVIPGHRVLIVAYACEEGAVAGLRISAEHRDLAWFAPADLGALRLPHVYRDAIGMGRR
ncbi:NUDIX domain-containing protein [Propionicimonas sp.]|uniref:NUDIX domain-containing protein n=1 Tax=Propionicimonas sp. TaxID=1955623 RepID=UPI0039E6A1D2